MFGCGCCGRAAAVAEGHAWHGMARCAGRATCTAGCLANRVPPASQASYVVVPLPRSLHTLQKGQTPLFMASCEGHLEAVQLLLQHGADANAPDEVGRTMCHLASGIAHDTPAGFLRSATFPGVVFLAVDTFRAHTHHAWLDPPSPLGASQ